MRPITNQGKKIVFRKTFAEFKKISTIPECFFHDKSLCKGDIKQSHSIQKNGRLSIIEGNVNGQNVIYTFSEFDIDLKGNIVNLKPIGKGKASTFFGFCDYHDTTLFIPIENNPFDESDEHCFMHSYRSFAHTYHTIKEALKGYRLFLDTPHVKRKLRWERIIKQNESMLIELEKAKLKIDSFIERREYDGLDYFTCIVPKRIPIACSSIINPFFSYKNIPLIEDANNGYPMIMFTVLPDYTKTIIILSCFSDDKKGKLLLDELNSIKFPLQFEKAISSLLINNAENTFFAPLLWQTLGTKGQLQLCKELKNLMETPTKFIHSDINFFDPRFEIN